MLGHILAIVLPIGFWTSNRQTSVEFPDNGQNHWVYVAKADFQSLGLLIGYTDGLGRGIPGMNNYAAAVFTNGAALQLQSNLNDLSKAVASGRISLSERMAARSYLANLQRSAPRLRKEFTDLFAKFDSELTELGADVRRVSEGVRSDLLTLENLQLEDFKQFVDVPSRHWAASSVLNLRLLGILHGYPDGKFGG